MKPIDKESVFDAVRDGAYSVEQILVCLGQYNTEENALSVRANLQSLRKGNRIEYQRPSGWKPRDDTKTESTEFFVLSIKHTKRSDGLLTFWGPNNSGYQFRIDGTRCPAGRYTRAHIESLLGYYHDGVNVLAIPCADVEAASIRVGDCMSRSVDMADVDDRVVPFGKLRKLKSAALAWRKTGNEQ